MYRQIENNFQLPENFKIGQEYKLSPNNRWVIMAQLIPWAEFEGEYAQNFDGEMGAPAKPFRMALGALIIKEKLGTSDRETVEQIRENPYLQYFIGMDKYQDNYPFEPSMLVHFRSRIGQELVNRINQRMVKEQVEVVGEEKSEKKPEEVVENKRNRGQLIVDATCVPGDIKYPSDLGLLSTARCETERIIDRIYESNRQPGETKPRTDRNRARKEYLKVAKAKRVTNKNQRKAIKKQLQYIKRNLSSIERLLENLEPEALNRKDQRSLFIIKEVYRQQLEMYEENSRRTDDRIVSIQQPHIRPIVRGKTGKPVEFGAKISASCRNGYVFLDRISWDNYNESGDLLSQVEAFKEFTGYYPESVHADKIYRTKANRAWCKERGIRLIGPPLGRPKTNIDSCTKNQAREDERVRNQIEGKFGIAKRRFSLDRLMTKLSQTSETAIAITFLVMNLSTLLMQRIKAFFVCLSRYSSIRSLFVSLILENLMYNSSALSKYDELYSSFPRWGRGLPIG
jgi:transposase, IS5 family